MSSGRGGTRWPYCVHVISSGTPQSVTCAQTWQGWTYGGKPGSQHRNITLHNYLQGPESNYLLVIRGWTHGYCLLECCYGANGAIIFPAEPLFADAAHNVASTAEEECVNSPNLRALRLFVSDFTGGAHWKRPKPADKQPSGSVTEWCITAPLGGLTRIGSFSSDLDLDFQMLSVGSSSWRWMICSRQLQRPELSLQVCVIHSYVQLWHHHPGVCVCLMLLALWCDMYENSCCLQVAHLYQWLYFSIYVIKSKTYMKQRRNADIYWCSLSV